VIIKDGNNQRLAAWEKMEFHNNLRKRRRGRRKNRKPQKKVSRNKLKERKITVEISPFQKTVEISFKTSRKNRY
jgi:hypothetical protein